MARTPKAGTDKASPARGADKAPAAPKKPGRIKQMVEVYKQTQAIDSSTLPWMLAALIGLTVLFSVVLWLIFDAPVYGAFLGLGFGILAAMIILARKAQRAMYSRIEDQQGATLAVMQQIPRGWNVESDPAAFDARSRTMIFRASGRAGIALVAEGSSAAAQRLMSKEVSRMNRMFPNVPVHAIHVGRGEDEIPLPKLNSFLTRMKSTLTKAEAGEIGRRLRALPNPIRQAIPKGIDPMRVRPNRKALKGR
ncbi:MAG: DUF4191 domain-containing protein [Dermabacter sp.]|nr:DUF4191 domain-containing protein [Dermabacter sp.]